MNKKRVILVLRLIRNLLIGVLSSGWILLIAASINIQKCAEIQKLPGQEGPTFDTTISETIISSAKVLMVAAYWLTAVVVFWILVVANRLWPICKKPKDEQKQ